MTSGDSSSDSGTVFVEAVIASAIVAMVMATMLGVISDSVRRERAMEARRMALLVAQSQLADVGADIPLTTGETTGSSGHYAWRVDVAPYTAEGEANSAGALWKVDVTVRPRGAAGDLATLSTLRLGQEG